ncbi:hypothetical protein, partial [Candidatus Alkanophaga liquidiphilum]
SAMLMCTAEVGKPFNESGLASEYCFSEHDKCDAYRTQTAVNSDLLSSRRMVAYELAKYSVGSNTRIHTQTNSPEMYTRMPYQAGM